MVLSEGEVKRQRLAGPAVVVSSSVSRPTATPEFVQRGQQPRAISSWLQKMARLTSFFCTSLMPSS